MNKCGVSDVIATVLIIVFAITAVGILGSVVLKIVQLPQLAPENNCAQISIDRPVRITKVCYNTETSELEVNLNRKNFEVYSLEFILDGEKFSCDCESCSILLKNSYSTYYFSENSEEVSLIINNCMVETKNVEQC
jgi:FlaG/FlaF family flagellin (archaellin)